MSDSGARPRSSSNSAIPTSSGSWRWAGSVVPHTSRWSLFPGVTLEKTLQDRERLPWREVVELGIQICDALHYAHERGVVHRDLKPSNLMVTNDGKIKLTDFGIAKDLDKTALTATGRTLGTAAYMAPEQIRGTPAVSHKTDLYALGIVLYQMLVGKPAFEGSSPVVLMHCHLNEATAAAQLQDR